MYPRKAASSTTPATTAPTSRSGRNVVVGYSTAVRISATAEASAVTSIHPATLSPTSPSAKRAPDPSASGQVPSGGRTRRSRRLRRSAVARGAPHPPSHATSAATQARPASAAHGNPGAARRLACTRIGHGTTPTAAITRPRRTARTATGNLDQRERRRGATRYRSRYRSSSWTR